MTKMLYARTIQLQCVAVTVFIYSEYYLVLWYAAHEKTGMLPKCNGATIYAMQV